MAKKKEEYGNESIKSLKGADRVRKRPAVIFGSDGVEGCAHSIFEIVSNSIDEARDGHGNKINVTLYPDHSVEAAVSPSITIKLKNAGTGILCSANCTREANMARVAATMTFPLA